MTRHYVPKREPRVKQLEALDAHPVGTPAFAYLMAMRTGKTKVTCDDFGRNWAAGLVDDFCVIAPAGVYQTWARWDGNYPNQKLVGAITEDWPDTMLAISAIHVWESGTYSSGKRKRELDTFLKHKGGPRVLIINVEALSTVEMARNLLLEFCRERRVYVAVDESTIIKNPTSERAKFVVKKVAPLAAFRRILSGLIAPRSPLDLYAQFAFLDKRILGHDKYKTFEARYAITQTMDRGGRRFQVVVGHRHTEELAEKIKPYSFRVRLEDCYDMPEPIYQIVRVEMTDEQRKAYREIKEYATTQLSQEAHVTANSVITQLLRLHQVLCGHTKDENGVEHFIPERRTSTLLQFLEGVDGKVIIWCSYDPDIRKVSAALIKEYGDGSTARFWGGNKDTREVEEARFKNLPDCRFMVATASAGGKGRTWDMADINIYYSTTNDLEQRSQSEERPKGVGKTQAILNVDLQVPGTVEEKFIKALRGKIDLATIINGDNYKEWLI